MRPNMFRFALAAALLLPVPGYAQDAVPSDTTALAQATDEHARQRDGLLGLLAFALVAGYVLHRNGIRRILRLESASLSDPLTGVKNRRYLEGTIDMDVAASLRAHRTAHKTHATPKHADLVFMVIDLDNFKRINDEHGHDSGDRALTAIARALELTCRDSDLLLRWGGDEFLVVQRFIDRADAGIAADRFRQAVEHATIDLGKGTSAQLTCSVGYAAFPFRTDEPEALTWEQVVTLADLAAYSAKRDGRNACAGYIWNGLTAVPPADLAAISDPHMLLRLSAVRREASGTRAPIAPETPASPRHTQPRMRLNLMA